MQKSEALTLAQEAKKRLAETLNETAKQQGLGLISVGLIRIGPDYIFRADIPADSRQNLDLPQEYESYAVQYDFIGTDNNEATLLQNQLHRVSEAKRFLWDIIDDTVNDFIEHIVDGKLGKSAYTGEPTLVVVQQDEGGYFYLVGFPASDQSFLKNLDLPTEYEGFPVRYWLSTELPDSVPDQSLNIRHTR